MKRFAILFLIFSFLFPLALFADTFATRNEFQLRIMKYVEEELSLKFTSPDGVEISSNTEYPLNTDLDLNYSDPNIQVILSVETNKMTPYVLQLTFSPMTNKVEASSEKLPYLSRVYIGDGQFRPVSFNLTTMDDVSVDFPGPTTDDMSTPTSKDFPITFRFSDYISSYSGGSYIATMTVEVETV